MTHYGILDNERMRFVPDPDGHVIYGSASSAVQYAAMMGNPDHIDVVRIEGISTDPEVDDE